LKAPAVVGLAGYHSAKAQGIAPRAPATPLVSPADTILKNGKIVTVDTTSSIAQAIAILGDRIIAVGPDAAMAVHTSAATRVIDLKGRTLIPGLIDGHAHMDREALRGIFPKAGRACAKTFCKPAA
jgi:adenine deaminase